MLNLRTKKFALSATKKNNILILARLKLPVDIAKTQTSFNNLF